MEFSELFQGRRAVFSRNGKYLACICGDSVEIRYADTLLKAFKYECGDVVKSVQWSGDSVLLLCHTGLSRLKVFSIHSGSCVASLKQPIGNISQILWAADFRTILFVEPLLFRVSVWKVYKQHGQQELEYVDNVQPWAKPGMALSPNGKHLAVVLCGIMKDNELCKEHASKSTDSISFISTISWRTESVIRCDDIERLGGMVWSPNSNFLVVWSSDPLDPVLVICIRSNSVIGKWQSTSKLWPGVRDVIFSPSAQFMTIVSKNSKIFVVNCLAWCEELELDHSSNITDRKCKVFREVPEFEEENSVFVEVIERPVSISFLSSLSKTNKISNSIWSSGGRYLASNLALAPAVVWIWSTAYSFSLCCVIVMKQPVHDFQWDPVYNVLAVVDGQDSVILWNASEEQLTSLSVCTPVSRMLFQAKHLSWRHDGSVLAVSSDQNSTVLGVRS
ncbi:hypothetical protein ONE63_010902 [Megalurothrips usitatus]|uniref:WD repeat-containing protein WRAP73-like n=1 Tax=Megalurothrips usitatus TaxID=439358 RepID=A0AAV7XKZ8_9NEOP|nr:hypothetical protein ONE63_010902 [Megalurothrips usitatus]